MQHDMEATVAAIRGHHRTRRFAMEQRKRADLSLGAFLRSALGWRKDLPDAERKKIAEQAKALVTLGEKALKGKPVEIDEPAYEEWEGLITAALMARAPFDAVEKQATKAMEKLAKATPVWQEWGQHVKGFGPVSLAVIIGEAGDLSNYPKKGHLWKRLGLALVDGVRQGGLSKGASKDAWIAHGYNATRRSQVYVIGDVMVKVGDHYRKLYLARKEYERIKAELAGLTVAPSAKIPKGKAAEYMSDGHIHKRAQRYMEKILLRDLWGAWRRAKVHVPLEEARRAFPAAEEHRDERKANEFLPQREAADVVPSVHLIPA
jgi:hypothetical protein